MVGYNKNIRHMEHHGDITDVKIKMTLTNLISLVKLCIVFAQGVICDSMVYHLFFMFRMRKGRLSPLAFGLKW